MRAALSVVASLGLAVCANGAWAKPADESVASREDGRTPPPIELGLGGFAQAGFGLVCQQRSDLVDCANGPVFVGLQLAPHWRLSSSFSVGALGAIGWSPAKKSFLGDDGKQRISGLGEWRLEAEGRWHPLRAPSADPWVGVDAGLIALSDSLETVPVGGGPHTRASVTQLAPVFGAALGVDFRTASFLALGVELRGAVQSFGRSDSLLDSVGPIGPHEFGTVPTIALALNGTFLIAP